MCHPLIKVKGILRLEKGDIKVFYGRERFSLIISSIGG
jgi:hypothetical protein